MEISSKNTGALGAPGSKGYEISVQSSPADGIQLMAQIEEGVKSVSPEQTINYLKAHWGVLSDILRGIQPGSDHVVAFIEGK